MCIDLRSCREVRRDVSDGCDCLRVDRLDFSNQPADPGGRTACNDRSVKSLESLQQERLVFPLRISPLVPPARMTTCPEMGAASAVARFLICSSEA